MAKRLVPPPIGAETKVQRDQRLARTMERLDDFTEFRNAERNHEDGPIPGILLTNENTREWLEIIAHFDLFPIAFRRTEPSKGYVAIDFSRGEMAPTSDFDYLTERYSKKTMYVRGRLRRAPLFASSERALTKTLRVPPRDLSVCFAIPRPLMAYLNWKAFKTCEASGVEASKVRTCLGRLVRRGNTWVLRVDQLVLKTGATVQARGA